MKILVSCPQGRTFNTFFDSENIKYINSLGEVIWNTDGKQLSPESLAELIHDCHVYVMTWGAPPLSQEILRLAQKLRVVVYLGGSLGRSVCDETYDRGITVLCGADFYAASAAEGILAYIFAALRRIPEYSIRIKYRNEWRHSWDTCFSIMGRTVGLVNYSNTTRKLAEMLTAFDVKVLIYDKKGVPPSSLSHSAITPVRETELFSRSDIVCIQSPRGTGYYHSVSYDQFMHMKDNAILINTATGGVLDMDALYTALTHKSIFAVIDAYETEPPELEEEMLYFDNLILMPHMAGATVDIRAHITRTLMRECADVMKGAAHTAHAIKKL